MSTTTVTSTSSRQTFRTSSTIPMRRDNMSFRDRQRKRFDDLQKSVMQEPQSPENQWLANENPFSFSKDSMFSSEFGKEMVLPSLDGGLDGWLKQRRHEWDAKVERMEKDFFKLHDSSDSTAAITDGSGAGSLTSSMDTMMIRDVDGTPKFKASFDVKNFPAEAIKITITEDRKLVVEAKHEEKSEGKSSSKEFRRSVNIPDTMDEGSLTSTLSVDGILVIEAPLKAPQYQITDGKGTGVGTAGKSNTSSNASSSSTQQSSSSTSNGTTTKSSSSSSRQVSSTSSSTSTRTVQKISSTSTSLSGSSLLGLGGSDLEQLTSGGETKSLTDSKKATEGALTSSSLNTSEAVHTSGGVTNITLSSGGGAVTSYSKNSEGVDIYKISYEIEADYNPQDLKVETKGQMLEISGKLEQKTESGGSRYKEFKKMCELPANVDAKSVTAYFENGKIVAEGKVISVQSHTKTSTLVLQVGHS